MDDVYNCYYDDDNDDVDDSGRREAVTALFGCCQ
jgi:hypothetical protein